MSYFLNNLNNLIIRVRLLTEIEYKIEINLNRTKFSVEIYISL